MPTRFTFLNVLFYDNFHSIYKLPKWNSFSDCQLSLSIVLYTILNFNANFTYNNVRADRIHKHDKLKKHRNTQNTNFKCTGLRRSLHAALTMLNMYFNLSWLFKNYLSILVCRRPKIIWSVKLIQRYISLEQVYFKIVIFLF